METECVLWNYAVNSAGYGPHREVYEKHYGYIDPNLDVMHKCDVKRCINPLHLEQGTHSKNMLDARDRGLTRTKLDGTLAHEIREKYRKEKVNQAQLAKEYKVSRQLIFQVVTNQIWKEGK